MAVRKKTLDYHSIFDSTAILVFGDGRRITVFGLQYYDHGAVLQTVDTIGKTASCFGSVVDFHVKRKNSSLVMKLSARIVREEHRGSKTIFQLNFSKLLEHKMENGLTEESHIICHHNAQPSAWAEHPLFYKSQMEFKVSKFIKNGLILEFTKEIKMVIPQTPLLLNISLPGIGIVKSLAIVEELNFDENNDKNACKLRFKAMKPSTLELISRYIYSRLQDSDLKKLEELGFSLPNFDTTATLILVDHLDQLEEVLELRHIAYRGREGANLTALKEKNTMKDRFDDHSLVLSLKVTDKLVATARVVLNNQDAKYSEIGGMTDLPQWIWKKGFVELSRVATHPDYRGKDIFNSLTFQAFRLASQLGYRYVVANCESSLLPTYRKRGARTLGKPFIHPMEQISLQPIYYDIEVLSFWGQFISRKLWKRSFGDLSEYKKRYKNLKT